MSAPESIVIVGAGLCGTLTALMLSEKGHKVVVYESRVEKTLFADSGRSFNITLTERGMRGLRLLKRTNLDKRIIASGIKCYGRRVHKHPSEQSNQACCGPTKGTFYTPYGTNLDGNDFLLSIGRIALNKLLLKELVENKNITVHFGHKLKAVNLKAGSLSFETQDGSMLEASASVILGTDGCWSTVRQQMMRQTAVEFSQKFSERRYKELYTPPVKSKSGVPGYAFGGEKNADALHLWPCKDYMLLAMPNLDKSYSTTMFATEAIFDKLDKAGSKGVRAFFEENFPDAADQMTTLEEDYENNPVGTLTETRCFPYHYTASKESCTVLLGDSAHAMYPFMGQGTNAAFEDVFVLSQLLEKHEAHWPTICEEFSIARKPHLDALTDMAANHDKTLCTMAFSPTRLIRLAIAKFGGEQFRPLYSAVAFSAEPYGDCIKLEKQRMEQIGQIIGVLSYFLFAAVGIVAWAMFNGSADSSIAALAQGALGANTSTSIEL